MERILKLITFLIVVIEIKCDLHDDASKLYDSYFEWKLQLEPGSATSLGIHKYDDRLKNNSIEALKDISNQCEKFKVFKFKFIKILIIFTINYN